MHIIFREQRHLDEEAGAIDLGQSPAELVVLSFSDADLGAMASAWQGMDKPRPGLRLANLAQLRHPLSVDLYVEKVLSGARIIVIRLLGGLDYWRYGVEEVAALSRAQGINLAILAGDATVDARLAALSTAPPDALAALDGYLRAGGPENCRHALQFSASLAGLGAAPAVAPAPMPDFGEHMLPESAPADAPLAVLVFYRSHALSGDVAPITAMAQALSQRGLRCRAVFVDSLKAPGSANFIRATLRRWRPAVVLNATGFSARGAGDSGSPLDAADCPVLQVILAASTRVGWAQSARGLSPADMAMQMVLPECDGRLAAGAISFKTPDAPVPGLEYTRTIHQPDAPLVAMAAERAAGWAHLAVTRPGQRRLAIVLSDYPGAQGERGQIGHAVGLDSFASLERIIALLVGRGYDIPADASAQPLQQGVASACITLAAYETLFARLPEPVQAQVRAAWGEPESDPNLRNGAFHLVYRRLGKLLVAVQPERGRATARRAEYHDPDLPPCHGYIAFYLWLREVERHHALVHLGAHGTLEWLPGKALAPGPECYPGLLTGGVPVVYPFIVNNPGEAMAARRRLGAVVLGHLTPPLRSAGAHGAAATLERLLEDYAAADGLDRRRTGLLRQEILQMADANGLLAECGIAPATPQDDALARLDAYLCDVKELQIRDGLHVFGAPPTGPARETLLRAIRAASPGADAPGVARALDECAAAEADALLHALDGRFIAPGPAGAPSRGRADVLPTGRNLFGLDPRATPTRAALLLARKTAEAILTRHLQEHGDWPRSMMLDLWASSALRTGGEDLALAFVLMGVNPIWDDANRVSGVEILPQAELGRPRVDVTLHISGLFRDAFEPQIRIFNMAVAQLAARGELPGDGARALTRIYGAAPGAYGAGDQGLPSRAALGQDYLDAASFAYGPGQHGVPDAAGFAARVAAADALVHVQDHAEIDLLDGPDFAAFEGGFAAAAALLGRNPALYHADTSRPDAPRVRLVAEEVRRVVRGRAANPEWIAGMMRHGYRGAAEISRALDGLHGFAATLTERFDAQFELIFEATLGDPEVARFLQHANPAACEAMRASFRQANAQGLWHSRRNSTAEVLDQYWFGSNQAIRDSIQTNEIDRQTKAEHD